MDKADQDAERLLPEPKCPECRASVGRPKCLFELGSDCPRHSLADKWRSEVRAVAAALRERDAEILRLKAAIEATLELADFLNDAASRGAGFSEHWGERVLQAVEPLRDVGKFKDETLEHNRSLLDANGKNIEELRRLREEIDRLRMENASLTTAQPGAEQNLYFQLRGARTEIERLKTAWQLAINSQEMKLRSASISLAGWTALKDVLDK